ncbi:MAG: iron-containing alcohol dehydrogenase [Alphaproteobacteria bacterium]|nr:MAG: iron-containing alcohol dehydrogenase [Alphaproteobacteria bacterium]
MALITYLSSIEFGAGSIATLPKAISDLGIKRPALISDGGLAATGLVNRIQALVPGIVFTFLDVPTNPTETAVLDAMHKYRASGADGLVALGGGSPIDLAKGVALLASHPLPLSQYAVIEGGLERITAAVVPVIAVPTTAGTGAEVGRASLITLSDGRKLGFISPHLIPKKVICDPELLLGLPPKLTAATGMDALAHCIETYCSPRYNPPADAIALDGFARIWSSLERSVADGQNVTLRSEMMMGALQGGLAFQKGLGAVHSLSHALGALHELHLHHGTLNAILMPHVVRVNAEASNDKIRRMGHAAGIPTGTSLADALSDLTVRLGLPTTLSELEVTDAMFEGVVVRALADHSHATNPKLLTAQEYHGLLRAAL